MLNDVSLSLSLFLFLYVSGTFSYSQKACANTADGRIQQSLLTYLGRELETPTKGSW